MAKQYIEREAVLESISGLTWYSKNKKGVLNIGAVNRKEAYYPAGNVFDAVESVPAADVVEVVHGEWIIKSEIHQMFDDVDEEMYVECPFCKRTYYVPQTYDDEEIIAYAREQYPFCNCGAKMDGKPADVSEPYVGGEREEKDNV